MTELRKTDRQRTYIKAQARFNSGYSVINCLIRNISPTGAKLEIANHITLPSQFELYLPIKEKSYTVRIVWRATDIIGIKFTSLNDDAIGKSSASRYIDNPRLHEAEKIIQLELENAQLRSEILDLKQKLMIPHLPSPNRDEAFP